MPALYVAESRLYKNGTELKDEYTTPFGIRSIEIIPGKGFFLNGEKTVFKGVVTIMTWVRWVLPSMMRLSVARSVS